MTRSMKIEATPRARSGARALAVTLALLAALDAPHVAASPPSRGGGARSVLDHEPSVRPPARPARTAQVRVARPKSVPAAFAMELLLPGAGFIYTESYWEAGVEIALVAGGLALFFNNLSLCFTCDDRSNDNGLALLGLTMVIGGRAFGLIGAPMNARAYNRRFEDPWAALDLDAVPPPVRPTARDGQFIGSGPTPLLVLSSPTIQF